MPILILALLYLLCLGIHVCYQVDSIGLSFESFHVLFSHENPDLSDVLVGEEDSSQGVQELVNQLDASD